MKPASRALASVSRLFLPRTLAAAVASLVLASCGDSPMAPSGEGERIPFGLSIEADVTDSLVKSYSFVADSGTRYSLTIEALQGGVQVLVLDSLQHQTVAGVVVYPSTVPQGPSALILDARSTAVLVVEVGAARPSTAARFRFQVARIDPRPESVPSVFAIGDTVTGESLTPLGDLDIFETHGAPEQVFVGVFEALGAVGSGALSVSLTPLPSGGGRGGWVVGPGHPATETSGLIAIPSSGRVQFSFAAAGGITPVYQGPYRFWTYVIDRAPEHRDAAVPLGTAILGERIDRSGDVDEFLFDLGAGAELNAFLQAPRAFHLDILPLGGAPLATVVDAAPADTSLFGASTGRFQVQVGGTYVARVSSENLIADTGAYRIFLYPIDRRPEHVAQGVIAGDTVSGESIDLPGDVDEFTFSAAAGTEFNAFLQARDGSSGTHLALTALDSDGTVLGTAASVGADTSLLRQPAGRFAVRTTGTHRLRVAAGTVGTEPASAGPYRLLLSRIDRRPETHADTLVLGDSVLDESLDPPGDVDEFQVMVTVSSGASLVLLAPGGTSGTSSVSAALVRASDGSQVTRVNCYGAGVNWSGPITVAPGHYLLRLWDDEPQSRARGRYSVRLYRFRLGPEVAHDTIAIGDTIATEALDLPGDGDGFVFFGTRRQQINIALAGRSPAGPGTGFAAFLAGVGAGYGPWAVVWAPASSTVLTEHQTLRLELPYTGWYHLGLGGATSPASMADLGPYTFAVTAVPTAPEHASADLVPGDSVTSESLDAPGDYDAFHLTATPGQDVSVVFASAVPPSSSRFPYVAIVDPATGESLDEQIGQGVRLAGPVRVPASGQLSVMIYELPSTPFRQCTDSTCNGVYGVTTPYTLSVIAVNRAPESVPATYVQGDTVRGEALWPLGDVDEFQATGTPGDTLYAGFRLVATAQPLGGALTIEVVVPGAGPGSFSVAGSAPGFALVGPFVVPASGTYVIRIRGKGGFSENMGTAPYEFFVKRGP